MSDEWLTRQTLIMRAKNQNDHQAWEEFVSYYEKFIFIVLRRMDVTLDDCDDLVQDILVKTWKGLQRFEIDSERAKFRTWLNTIIRNTTITYIKKKQNREWKNTSIDAEDSNLPNILESHAESELNHMIDREWEAYISTLAIKNIKPLFSEKAFVVFDMFLDGKSIEEISKTVGIKENSVYKLKNRVKARLIAEVRRLCNELQPGKDK